LSYEELIVAIADAAPKLPESSLRLLLHLVALGLKERSCELHVSHRTLATDLGMSREGIAMAARGLAGIVQIDYSHGVTSVFILPRDWFAPQLSLFSRSATLRGSPGGNVEMIQSGLPTRPPVANLPGHRWPTNQATWPTDQATWPTDQATSGLPTRPRGQPTRPPVTQNQQLTNFAAIRSDPEALSSTEAFVILLDRIARVHRLEEGQRKEASELSDLLYPFMVRHSVPEQPLKPPPEKVVARCLAIADIETLKRTLEEVEENLRKPIRKYAWFVTIFLQQIHQIPPELVLERFQISFQKRPPRPYPDRDFKQELLRDTVAGVRNMA
jgi:hypothetical protein